MFPYYCSPSLWNRKRENIIEQERHLVAKAQLFTMCTLKKEPSSGLTEDKPHIVLLDRIEKIPTGQNNKICKQFEKNKQKKTVLHLRTRKQ